MNTNKSDNESRLLIQNQYFLNENSLAQYIEWEALARVSFVNCNFEKVHLLGKVLGLVVFKIAHLTILTLGKLNFQVVILKIAK